MRFEPGLGSSLTQKANNPLPFLFVFLPHSMSVAFFIVGLLNEKLSS